jgi:SAM-dependent methyltransferase
MTTQLVFDEDWARRIEAVYEIEDAVRRRRIVRDALAAAPGERVVDVGCGPGFYCAELADDVGPGGSVTGIDTSEAMLALARRRCAAAPNVELRQGDATAVPLPDMGADAAISVQVQEYVEDVGTALAELRRILRPGGRVLVFDIDWATYSLHTEQPELTARVQGAWDEHLAHRSLPRTLAPSLRGAGFGDVRAEAHPLAAIEFDPSRRHLAAMVAFIGAFVPGRGGLSEADAQAWVADQRTLGERGAFYATVTQFCFTARRP